MFVCMSKNFLFYANVDKDEKDGVKATAFSLRDGQSRDFEWSYSPAEKEEAKKSGYYGPVDVISGCISPNEHLFAFGDNHKNLFVFDVYQNLVLRKRVARNCTRIQFRADSKRVVYMDKSDIYEVNLETDETKDLLGHLSMLLDFLITPDDKFIISADRDEKIRVSHYPNTYNIWTYCLGHEQFVSCVRWLAKARLIVSGSGDGTVRLWNIDNNGKQVAIYDFKQPKEESNGGDDTIEYDSPIKSFDVDVTESLVLVSFYKRNEVVVLQIGEDLQLIKRANLVLPRPILEAFFDRAHANFFWVFGGHDDKALASYQLDGNEVKNTFNTLPSLGILSEEEEMVKTFQSGADNRDTMVQGLFKYQYELEKTAPNKESNENQAKKLKS